MELELIKNEVTQEQYQNLLKLQERLVAIEAANSNKVNIPTQKENNVKNNSKPEDTTSTTPSASTQVKSTTKAKKQKGGCILS